MSKRVRYLIIFAVVVFVIFLIWFFFFRTTHKVPKWKTANIERGNITINVTATGSLSALTTVQVGTQVSGIISKLFVDYNSEVKKDQVVALLDTTLLGASREGAYALMQKAKTQLKELKWEFERQQKLYNENVIPKADYQLSLSNYQGAVSALQSAEAELKRARINRQYAVIKAPIDGVVISRNVDVGQTVVASFNSPVLFTIANDLKKMQVYANVDEADIGQVRKDQDVVFTVDAFPTDTFTGKVNQIRLSPVIVQNVVTYIVIIDVENPDLKLLPGLTANIYFKVNESRNVLKVPTRALQFLPPDEYLKTLRLPEDMRGVKRQIKSLNPGDVGHLWIARGDSLIPIKVKVGLTESGFAEVSGNIKDGEEVVVGIDQEAGGPTTKNPFMPTFRQPRR